MRRFLSYVLILVGLSSFLIAGYFWYVSNLPVQINRSAEIITTPEQKFPILIRIPSLDLELPITLVSIKNQKWDDPGNTVGYYINSVLPGDLGNSVFYAHNRPNLFGKLKEAQKFSSIIISFNDETIQEFIIASSYEVTPDQTHILNQTTDVRLTLYTCSGFLDMKRYVVIAIPSNPYR